MDRIDEQLIAILVENARTSLKDLSQKVNLPQAPLNVYGVSKNRISFLTTQ